jgi:hypothetical protein
MIWKKNLFVNFAIFTLLNLENPLNKQHLYKGIIKLAKGNSFMYIPTATYVCMYVQPFSTFKPKISTPTNCVLYKSVCLIRRYNFFYCQATFFLFLSFNLVSSPASIWFYRKLSTARDTCCCYGASCTLRSSGSRVLPTPVSLHSNVSSILAKPIQYFK